MCVGGGGGELGMCTTYIYNIVYIIRTTFWPNYKASNCSDIVMQERQERAVPYAGQSNSVIFRSVISSTHVQQIE